MFKANLETFIIASGRHILCTPSLVDKNSNGPTPIENLTEEEKSKAICIFKKYGGHRCDELSEEINNAAYVGRDKYPIDTSVYYELMVSSSVKFQGNGHHHNSSGGCG